jgi:hypothetical protein
MPARCEPRVNGPPAFVAFHEMRKTGGSLSRGWEDFMMAGMPIYLDGERLETSAATLGGLHDEAQRRAADGGRIIVEVALNGEPLTEAALEVSRNNQVLGSEIRLESADPRELAGSTLEQVRQGLGDARAAQSEAANLFQQDQPSDAMQQVSRAISVWQQTQQAVLHSTMLLGIKLDEKTFEDQPVLAMTDSLLGQLRGLRDLIAAGDTVGLADTLAYEWPEMTDRWDRLIVEIQGWIEKG